MRNGMVRRWTCKARSDSRLIRLSSDPGGDGERRVPEDVAVVGFDNIDESAYLYPSLTTVAQDLQLLGQQAVQNIVAMLQARQENRFITDVPQFIQPTLVVRESSQTRR